MRCSRFTAALLTGLGATRGAGAQVVPAQPDGGPVIVGESRQSLRSFELHRLSGAVDFLGEHRYERVEFSDGTSRTDRVNRFRSTLDLFGEASVGHRNLLLITGAGQLGLESRDIDSETLQFSGSETDFVNLYNVSGLLLGNGPAPVTVYSLREQNVLDRAFAGTVEDTLTESGAAVQFRSAVAPTTLRYFHRVHEQSDFLDRGDTTVTQDTFAADSSIRLSDAQRLDIAYTFDHISEDQEGFFSDTYDRHDANIVHTVAFGGEQRPHELRSSLRLFDQSGDLSQQDLRLDELLVLRHTERLETRYILTAAHQERGDDEQDLYRAQASIRHRLFESLVSSATVGAARLDAPDGFTSDEYFVSGNLDYTKSVPLGRLDAAAGASYTTTHNSARGGTVGVLNQPFTFNDPFPIVIPRPNIVAGSIVVRPPSGFPIYLEGVDYTVATFPDRAEIRVPAGSTIVDGQTVLVSYDIGPEPASDVDVVGTTLSVRYSLTEGALAGLAGYVAYRTTNYSVDAADEAAIPFDDSQNLLLGVSYLRGGLDITYEHEIRESDFDPFTSDRFHVLYRRLLGPRAALGLQYAHEETDFSEQNNRVVFDRVTALWDQRLDRSLDVHARLEYRNERNDLSGDSEAFDQVLGLTWHRGSTAVYGSIRNAFLNGEATESTTQRIEFGLRRSF